MLAEIVPIGCLLQPALVLLGHFAQLLVALAQAAFDHQRAVVVMEVGFASY